MTDVQTAAEALFARYFAAWNARDFEGVADCFDAPCQFVTPDSVLGLPDRAALIEMLEGMFARLEADGFGRTELGPVTARECNDGLAIRDVKNVARLRADGSALDRLDAHYVMRRTTDGWRLATAVPCARGWNAPV